MKRNHITWLLVFIASVLIILAAHPLKANPLATDADDEVQAAWKYATELGVYDFDTDITQTIYPAPLIANTGRTSTESQLYLEGQVNIPDQEMTLALWENGGNVLNNNILGIGTGIEILIKDGQAFGRQSGGEWQEMEDFSGAFAPGQDPLAYLSGIKNVQEEDSDSQSLSNQDRSESLNFTKYTFDIDGPAFARHMRDQLETQLHEAGELPIGITLNTPQQYIEMTGEGEVWIDEHGLPLRLHIHMIFPPEQSGKQVEADIQTDFSGFPDPARVTLFGMGATWLQTTARNEAPSALIFAISMVFLAVLVTNYHSKKVYAACVIALIASMILTPLLQSHQAYAFSQRMETTRTEQADIRETEADLMPSTWSPHQAPMQATTAQSTSPTDEESTDTDQDGLSDEQETLTGTDPTNDDTDGDGIQDGNETLHLGTNPLSNDSDGDQIVDIVEIDGFEYAGQHWYLDPNNPDTNGDGRMDALECPELVDIDDASLLGGSGIICDTDGDGNPNPFDYDDDNDGVPDNQDYTPEMSLDRTGRQTKGQHSLPFNSLKPFTLQVDGLGEDGDWPVLVDLQYRPANPDHLAYALNVLDWPEDSEGQMQHTKNTTYATSDNAKVRETAGNSGWLGDMRLIPMLEIEITGDSVPFKLTTPAIDVTVYATLSSGTLSGTLHLTQQEHIRVDYAFHDTRSYTVNFYSGKCGTTGALLATHTATDGSAGGISAPDYLTGLADGKHAVKITVDGESVCTDIGNIINGPYENQMIDPEPLKAYGISVREANQDGTLLAYAPANIVKDTIGSSNVAFASRMLYMPGEGHTWEQPQNVRLVWAVEAITDWCNLENFEPSPDARDDTALYDQEFTAWCKQPKNRTTDEVQIVHTYDDTWYLTGMSVREDLGLDIAIAYEDPSTDGDLYQEDALWHLARGLGNVFVAGRNSNENRKRDIAITSTYGDTTIQERFDRFSNSNTSEEERWGILQDALRVETFQYPHQDHVTQIAMTETPRILEQFPHNTTPTLLFAREEHYRSTGLEAAIWDMGTGQLNFTASTEQVTTASLQWSPFQYTSNSGWENISITEYWDTLDVTLTQYFQEQYPDDSEDVNAGRMIVARAFYVSLVQGLVNNVEHNLDILWTRDPAGEDSDQFLKTELVRGAGGLKSLAKSIGALIYQNLDKLLLSESHGLKWLILNASLDDKIDLLYESLAKGVKHFFVTPWTSRLASLGTAKMAAVAGVAGAGTLIAVGLTVAAASQANGVEVAVRVMLGLGTVAAILPVVQSTAELVKVSREAGSIGKAIESATKTADDVKKCIGKMAIIGLAIGFVVAWGLAAVTIAFSDRSRAAIGYAVSSAVALTIVTLIMFVIEAIPFVGPIIGATVALIDAAVTLLCASVLSKGQQQGTAATFFCGGLTGLATEILKAVLYSNTVMVDMQPDDFDRLWFGNFEAHELVDPNKGFVVGNRLKVGLTITNTIQLADRPASVGSAYWYQWDKDTLKTSTFRYQWQTSEDSFHDDVSRSKMKDRWHSINDPDNAVQTTTTLRSNSGIPLSKSGINQSTSLYLSEAYAIPVQECTLGICKIKSEKDTLHYNIGQNLKLDIFPATLDEFYELAPTSKDDGYTLAWDTTHFPTLQDADGDGLTRSADPNDSLWDTDGDGLSDLFERQNGGDPTLVDTDNDDLDDYTEARLGTALNRPDTDGDGLSDVDEVAGWKIIYGLAPNGSALRAWITSDPLEADADNDTLTDFQEKTYGLNPNLPSNTTILSMESIIQENGADGNVESDGFIAPGTTLYYEATIENELDNRYAQGLLDTDFPQAIETNDVPPTSFILYPEEEQVMAGSMQVSPVAKSGAYSLTQTAGAAIVDWSTLSGGAQLWLPFEDESNSEIYTDQSGNLPTHNGQCVGDRCQLIKDRGRYGGALWLPHTDSYISTELQPSEYAYALSLWFKTDQVDGGLASVEDTHGMQLYLHEGKVCVNTPYFNEQTICSEDTYNDGQWHHIAHTFGIDVGGQRLYVDGIPVNRSTRGYTRGNIGQLTFGHGRLNGIPNFSGYLDDVRIYNTSLSDNQVQTLFSQPVLDLHFSEDIGWEDHSIFNNDGTCPTLHCPTHTEGVVGGAANFNSNNCLGIDSDASLDLSQGNFSIVAWVYPQSGSGNNQNILGMTSGDNNAYPTLERVGRRLHFGFGTGTAWAGTYESGEVLTEDDWNHIALTFDGTGGNIKLYVNGTLVDEDTTTFTGQLPSSTATTFGVGCSIATSIEGTQRFTGMLDEVRIYRETLDNDAVQDLYNTATILLHIPFDETPGVSSFSDETGQLTGACSGEDCPTSGVAGRINQAAWFQNEWQKPRGQRDMVSFSNSEINRMTNDFTLAMWIKPQRLEENFWYGLLSTGLFFHNGFSFYLDGSELHLNTHNVMDYNSEANLTTGSWTHVAVTLDSQNTARFYVNGIQVGEPISHTTPAKADNYQSLVIGAIPPRGGTTGSFFDGSIDDVYVFRRSLSAEEIEDLYHTAPVFQMHLDETQRTTLFTDDSGNENHGSCTTCPQSGQAIEGQIGQAVEFDGDDTGGNAGYITIPNTDELKLETFSISAWVRPTAIKDTDQIIIKRGSNYCMYIAAGSLMPVVNLSGDYATSSTPLVMNHWNHIVGTFDLDTNQWHGTLKIYVNGYEQGHTAATPRSLGDNPLYIGGNPGGNEFAGRIDEVAVYDYPLTTQEIQDSFVYQASWVEDRQNHEVTVDAELPNTSLYPPTLYWPVQSGQLLAFADDLTSGIARAELGIQPPSQPSFTWTEMPECIDTVEGKSWCPTFTPDNAGTYTIKTRATDLVGHVNESTEQTIRVDDTPPTLSINSTALINLFAHPSIKNTWNAHIEGEVTDPLLPDGTPGSGIPEDGVHVSLYTTDDNILVGEGDVTASVNGTTWTVDYLIPEAEPDNEYLVHVSAVDEAGRFPGIGDTQLARHTSTAELIVPVDGTGPAVQVDQRTLPSSDWTHGLTRINTLQGVASEQPVPLEVTWATNEFGDSGHLDVQCNNVVVAEFREMEPNTPYTWQGQVPQGASCQVFATKYSIPDFSVKVCDTGLTDVSALFTADAATCPADRPVSGLDTVELGWEPLLPGSVFYNQPAPDNQILHLPFEDTTTAEDNLEFQDISGKEHNGKCTGDSCPTADTGHVGSGMHFDGVDDIVTAALDDTPRTISLWFKIDKGNAGTPKILYEQGDTEYGFSLYIFGGQLFGMAWNPGMNYPGYGYILSEGISPEVWHHVVFMPGSLTLYVDGELANIGQGQGFTASKLGQAGIGRAVGETRDLDGFITMEDGGAFKGILDEVRVFTRELSETEIHQLYTGADSVLTLSFDNSWIIDNDTLTDESSWGQQSTLHTSSDTDGNGTPDIIDEDNKAVPGHVGTYALALDGIDDYVHVTAHPSLDLGKSSNDTPNFTQMAWIYPVQRTGLQPVLSDGIYHKRKNWYPFIYVLDSTRLQVGFGNGATLTTFTTGDVLTPETWNHVATTFDGTTYRIYVNGEEQAATTDFAGKRPVENSTFAIHQFDIGRGTVPEAAPCATLSNITLKIERGLQQQYRIKLDNEVLFTTPLWPNPNQSLNADQTIEFCAISQLDVEMRQGDTWVSMLTNTNQDNYTIDPIEDDYGTNQKSFVHPHYWSAPSPNLVRVYYDIINQTQVPNFEGKVDDVRIYPRALSDIEINSLARSAAQVWQTVTPTPNGDGVVQGDWITNPAEGMEGAYQLNLRSTDMGGHVNQSNQNVWRGDVDTLAPRVSVTRIQVDDRYYRYTTVAEDYNLDAGSFRSPCGGSEVAEYEDYQIPSYLALEENPQLYRLRTDCVIPKPGYVAANIGGWAQGLTISGTLLYIAGSHGGVQIRDISDPLNKPEYLGTYRARYYAPALSIHVEATPPTGTRRVPLTTSIETTTDAETTVTTTESSAPASMEVKNERAPAGTTYYVTPTGTGNCATWANACDLQTALATATWGTEIWAAEGTYYPTTGLTRTLAFTLNNGIALYGGFAGGESTRDARDPTAHPTLLSGDIGTPGDTADNTYHVVAITAGVTEATVLDGFTITGGNANNSGGGIYNTGGSPTLQNLTIQDSYATNHGGGMYSVSGRPTLSNTNFINNSASNGGGLADGGDGFTLRDVTFQGNVADGYGGGLYNNGDSDLVNVTFKRNTTNYAYGGGMSNSGNSHLVNAAFYGNIASAYGGDGGGLYNNGDMTLVNVVFSGNESAAGSGGGMYNNAKSTMPTVIPSNLTMINTTFSGNEAASGGSAIHNSQSNATIQNSILWGNTSTQMVNLTGTVTVTYSLVEGGWTGTGNLDTDPQFIHAPSSGTDGIWGTIDDDYGALGLQGNSPAIDAGDSAALPTDTLDLDNDGIITETLPLDLARNPRLLDVAVEMGAYEKADWVDLILLKSVIPSGAAPGKAITYTLTFYNGGSITTTTGCRITDTLPTTQVLNVTISNSGADITPTGTPYAWQTGPLAPGAGGIITITGIINPALSPGDSFINTAVITSTSGDADITNNRGTAILTVTPSNYPPIANDIITETLMDVPIRISILPDHANDPDGDPITLAEVGTPNHGNAAIEGTAIRYTPETGFSGTDTFTYIVRDSNELTGTGTIQIEVLRLPTGATAYVGTTNWLLILDVQDPTNPQYVGHYDTLGAVRGLTVSGTLAYIADDDYGLHIVDITVPPYPVEIAGLPLGNIYDVAVFEQYAYAADFSGALHVIDISNPANPQLTSSPEIPGNPVALDIANSTNGHLYVYIAAKLGGLQIVDVTDPHNVQIVGNYDTVADWNGPHYENAGEAFDVSVTGQYAYVGTKVLHIIDISDPTNPKRVHEEFDWTGNKIGGTYGYGVAISGDPAQNANDYVYIATGILGVKRVKLTTDETASACDTMGNCFIAEATTKTTRSTLSPLASQAVTPNLQTALINIPSVVDNIEPLSITVLVKTLTTTLQTLSVTVDGTPLYTQTWAAGATTSTLHTQTWIPGDDGQYIFQTYATAWDNTTATQTISMTVDTQPPHIAIDTHVLTTTHYQEPRTLDLTGVCTDAGGIAEVQYQASDGEWQPATVTGDAWQGNWKLPAGDLPDGITYIITATAQDIVGHLTTVTGTVFVDVVAPTIPTPTLSNNGQTLSPDDVLRTLSPTLTLTWPPASDGSGVDNYEVHWTETSDNGTLITKTEQTSGTMQVVTYNPGEAHKVSLQLTSRDIYGNQRWLSWGSIIMDTPLTPDYTPLNLVENGAEGQAWLNNGCSLIGADRRAIYSPPDGISIDERQSLYITWNTGSQNEGLRTTWTGADWDNTGDLFIYLDVQDTLHPVISGTLTTFTPYTTSSVVTLPTGIAADYLVWVRDEESALLMYWNGTTWSYKTSLTTNEYQYNAALNGGQSDIFLPFDTLSITHPSSTTLNMVAFAEKEGAVWTTLPNANTIHTPFIKERGDGGKDYPIQLEHHYHWDSLSVGMCPNGSDGNTTQYLDIEGQVSLSANPPGTTGTGNTPTQLHYVTGQTPVGHGQTTPYTFTYRNQGTMTASGLILDLTTDGTLRLPGGDLPDETHRAIPLDDIGPDEEVTVYFDGIVDATANDKQTSVIAEVHTASGLAIEQLWLAHPVDNTPPVFYGLQQPSYLINPGIIQLSGYAYDAAGITKIQLQFRTASGKLEALTCPDTQPYDGRWTCMWDASTPGGSTLLIDTQQIEVRLRAIDGFGQTGSWNSWQVLHVDTTPPAVELDTTATSITSGSLVNDSAFTLVGNVTDAGGVEEVEVCLDDSCEIATLHLKDKVTAVTIEDIPADSVAINAQTVCGNTEIARTFWVSDSFAIGQVSLGLNIAHTRRDNVKAVLESPSGTQVQVLHSDDLLETTFQNYAVYLDDTAEVGLFDAQGDDDLAPIYGRQTRPYQPLQAFQGEDSAGQWTLYICDTAPDTYNGTYERGRLVVTPRHSEATTARWTASPAIATPVDYISQTITIHSQDIVGNTNDNAQSLDIWIDNVAPVITLTEVVPQIELGKLTTVLSGTVSDGGPSNSIFIHIQTPDGQFNQQQAAREGEQWWFDLQPWYLGQYTLWVNARDLAGNVTTVGPFEIDDREPLYLPVIMKE